MKLDDALLRIGGYGRFQLLCYSVIGFVCMRGVWHLLSIFFIGYATPHSCNVPANSSFALPPCNEGGCQCEPDKCKVLQTNGSSAESIPCPDGWRYDGDWVSRWHFGMDYETTIVREWNLVCDNNYLVDLSTTIFMAGVLCGAVLITPLSDKYGRKKVLFPCLWLQGVLGIGLAFVTDFVQFAVLRFFIGILNQAIALVGYVYMVEIFPPSHRTTPSVGLQIFWSAGIMLLALFAFLLKNWRYLELAISIPCLAFLPIYWLVPESAVWLVSAGKLRSAELVLERAARVNGRSSALPPHCLVNEAECTVAGGWRASFVVASNRRGHDCKDESLSAAPDVDLGEPAATGCVGAGDGKQVDSGALGNVVTRTSTDVVADGSLPERLDSTVAICGSGSNSSIQEIREVDEAAKPKHTVLDLFRTPVIRRYTLSMFVIWFVNSMDYLGLSLAISDLHGDKYLNFFLSGVVEMPAYIVGALLVNRVGRKKPLFAFMLLSGVANILTALIPLAYSTDCQDATTKWLITAIALVGKFGISGSFCIVFLFASEIFPTSIRNIGVGVCSFWDTVGGMVAPQVNYAASVIPWLPRTIFGAFALVGAAFVLLLPETHNEKLPDDVNDVEAMAKGKATWSL